MAEDYWQRQTKDNPLFSDLLWSRPENKQARGKLLIIGGNAHGFAVPAQAYNEALKAGIGAVRVLLPDVLRKTVGGSLNVAEFASSTPSGSFSQKALAEMLDLDKWADGVLIAGELGRNAETAAVLENYLNKSRSLITITRDALNIFNSSPETILRRPKTTLVLSVAQLQRLAGEAKFTPALTFDMDLLRLVDWLRSFSGKFEGNIVLKHLDNIFVAVGGQVSSTPVVSSVGATTGQAKFETDKDLPAGRQVWRVKTAAHTAVWWLQNPGKPFEALSTSIFGISKEND